LIGEMTQVFTPPRKVPTQRRSQQTVQRILDGAESALARIPLEFLTANRIAKQAGLSVAALYRFFPNKQAVLDAVAMEHVKRIRECLETRVVAPLERDRKGSVPRFNPIEFLENVIDTYIAYLDENVAFRVLALGQLSVAGEMPRRASPVSGLPWVMKSFLVERMRVPNTPELDLRLQVLTETVERLISFAYEQKTDEARGMVLEEMKRMLTGYLFVRG
jgi:AcrR family transcriptional regulator